MLQTPFILHIVFLIYLYFCKSKYTHTKSAGIQASLNTADARKDCYQCYTLDEKRYTMQRCVHCAVSVKYFMTFPACHIQKALNNPENYL